MITIDDFSSGPHALEVAPGSAPTSVRGCQSGTMLGGGRHTYLRVVQDPRGQPARLDAGSGYLDVSLGAEQVAHIDVMYGWAADNGSCTENPLVGTGNGDLLSIGNAIRTTFNSAITENGQLNFNVIVSSAGRRSEAGGNVNVSQTPVNIDFWFAGTGPPEWKFGNAGLGVPRADFSAVTSVIFRFQATGDFVIDSFEVI